MDTITGESRLYLKQIIANAKITHFHLVVEPLYILQCKINNWLRIVLVYILLPLGRAINSVLFLCCHKKGGNVESLF